MDGSLVSLSMKTTKGLLCLTTGMGWDEFTFTRGKMSFFLRLRRNLYCESVLGFEPLSPRPWHNTCASTALSAIKPFTEEFHYCQPDPRGFSQAVQCRRKNNTSILRNGRISRLSSRKIFLKSSRKQFRGFSPLTWKALQE